MTPDNGGLSLPTEPDTWVQCVTDWGEFLEGTRKSFWSWRRTKHTVRAWNEDTTPEGGLTAKLVVWVDDQEVESFTQERGYVRFTFRAPMYDSPPPALCLEGITETQILNLAGLFTTHQLLSSLGAGSRE